MQRKIIGIAIIATVLAMASDSSPPQWESHVLSDDAVESIRELQRTDPALYLGAMVSMYGDRR